MRLLRSVLLMAVVATPMVIAASSSANAACFRHCTAILSSGFCTQYGPCEEMLESIATNLKPLRSAKTCRATLGIVCDYNSCKPVCGPAKQPQ